MRELDRRANDGLIVSLHWDASRQAVILHVTNEEGVVGTIDVPGEKARDAFVHPFVYLDAAKTAVPA